MQVMAAIDMPGCSDAAKAGGKNGGMQSPPAQALQFHLPVAFFITVHYAMKGVQYH
ncbi:MAG: hypothetical protein HKP58_08755 [Desulfatitalea sp.]|nr:hypothetical protein [Desulfatitalea sp.]NNK00488.1 hypothetical protein [Desulfatitalea sp.]